MKVGYIRVSTQEQNTARQEALLQELGAERLFVEKAGGSYANRPVLREMMSFLREGDVLLVESISRFARNTKDLLGLMEKLAARGVTFVSQKEAIDTSTPTGRFMLTVFGAVAQLEREYLLQRQKEGIRQAKLAGKYKGRKPIALDARRFDEVLAEWRSGGITAVQAQKKLGLSASTFYRRVKQAQEAAPAPEAPQENPFFSLEKKLKGKAKAGA